MTYNILYIIYYNTQYNSMNNKEIFILLVIVIFSIFYIFNLNETFENNVNDLLKIKKIKPEINLNSNSDFLFISAYTPNILPYVNHSMKNIIAYCKKYNYGLKIYNQTFNDSVYPCWNKIASILENLSKCKYLVWIDSDALVTNFSIKIDKFINDHPKYDLYICEDIYVDKECVNSGVMIIKNTSWSYNLFNKVWLSNIPHKHNDQNVIWLEIMKEIVPDVPIKLNYPKYCSNLLHPKVKVLHENNFNSNIYNYLPNDFILHLMGVNMECRIDIMRQINTKLGLDNYPNSACVNVLESNSYKNKENKKVDIDKLCLKK